ncbi:hypothetical protein GPECTOR_20g490 [Gonium pectorale]|uniref:Tr-type G domain-containing protein n=1 Tax=Gonium pectorale TaxID=33097 RepID=A0A150GIJ7_GONPE|nr:hypothetical protein GPECTOR_20g490 [Gonium pectorale]|eukprot:KXZ49633.1 hypothetical protein GPECTOR_20g490 [Gonium pectorale]
MAEPEGLPHATIVFVGHHQAGKSTTAGHIIVRLSGISKRAEDRVLRETSNRPTSRYAWVLDRLRLERERSMTVDLKLSRCVLPPALLAPATPPAAAAASTGAADAASPAAPPAGPPSAAASLCSRGLALTLVDTPGHPDYLRNCIAGITQADVAVLVVDSRPAVLDSPSVAAQTRDLGQLAYNLSSHRALVVAVNHLDVALESDAAEQRFNDAAAAITKLLKRKEGVTFVPVSGYTGENLVEHSPKIASWWSGGSLLEAVAAAAAAAARAPSAVSPTLPAPTGGPELPLRIPVISVYKVGGIGTVPAGRIAGGSLRRGALLCATPAANGATGTLLYGSGAANGAPTGTSAAAAAGAGALASAAVKVPHGGSGLAAEARSIESFHASRPAAAAGEWVGCAIKGVPASRLRRGCVLSDAAEGPARLAASFTAKIQVLRDPTSKRQDKARQLKEGYVMRVHVHTAQAPCRLDSVKRLSAKGEALDGSFLREGDIAEVGLTPLAPLLLEPYAAYPGLGRFVVTASALADMRGTKVVTPVVVAMGLVLSVQYVDPVPAPALEPAALPGPAKGASRKSRAASGGGAGAEVEAHGQDGAGAQGEGATELGGYGVAEPGGATQQQLEEEGFLRAAVRTQALHAASRQLAPLGEALAATVVAAGGAGGEAGAHGPPGDNEAVIDTTMSLLHFTYGTLITLICSLPPGVPEPLHAAPPDQPLVAELAEALESSQVLEHAARVVLLALVRVSGPLSAACVRVFRFFAAVHMNLASLAVDYCCSTDAATAATGARLRRALCGCCVTHAALCLGLSTLVSADGGSSYGLDEIVRIPSVRAVAGECRGASSNSNSDTHYGEETLLAMALRLYLSSTTAPRPPARPCRRGAFYIALRAGRLDVASAAAAALASGGGPQPPPLAAPTRTTGHLATTAFEVAALQLYPPDPTEGWSAATDSEAEVELWRLGVSALRWALPWAVESWLRKHCRCLREAWSRAEIGSGQPANQELLSLPQSPPRLVAAALAGGLLPCLEYLLRSAGRDPGGWQAAAVGELACLGEHLAPLLAYGNAVEAAALVATLGKLLRRAQADPRVMEGVWNFQGHVWQAILLTVYGLFAVVEAAVNYSRHRSAPEGVLEAPGPEPVAAAADAVEAAPEPASPASQQLANLLSLAACHWLPPLSRLAQAALTPQPLCADPARGAGSGDIGGGGCGDASGISPMTASLLVSATLSWVPLLRACCGPQAAHRAPAPEGAGGSERDSCGDDGGWRALLLEEVEAVPLVGVALEFLPELEAAGLSDCILLPLLKRLARCSGHLAALQLADTARGAAADAAGPSSGRARGGADGAGRRSGSGEAGSSGTGPGSRPPLPALPWQPELLRGLGAQLRAYELPEEAEAAEAVAEAMGRWAGGKAEEGGREGGGAVTVPETVVDPVLLRLGSAMPPPAAARSLLRLCANPDCANLDGDSEAGLRLTPCTGCGKAAYCCRDCWMAHWRAGHRAACARRLGGAG